MSKKNIPEVDEHNVTESNNVAKFTVKELGAHARELFGVSQSTYAGATYMLSGKYSIEEMKNHINSWLKKEVK